MLHDLLWRQVILEHQSKHTAGWSVLVVHSWQKIAMRLCLVPIIHLLISSIQHSKKSESDLTTKCRFTSLPLFITFVAHLFIYLCTYIQYKTVKITPYFPNHVYSLTIASVQYLLVTVEGRFHPQSVPQNKRRSDLPWACSFERMHFPSSPTKNQPNKKTCSALSWNLPQEDIPLRVGFWDLGSIDLSIVIPTVPYFLRNLRLVDQLHDGTDVYVRDPSQSSNIQIYHPTPIYLSSLNFDCRLRPMAILR